MMKLKLMTAFLMAIMATGSYANSWDKNQQAVWNVVLKSYKDIEKRDVNWTDNWVTEDAIVWGNSTPMPMSRSAVKRWDKFQFADGSTNNIAEYSPAAIVVHGDTAVAHYYYSNGITTKEGKQMTVHGRCTDILVKAGKSWKFLSWHCADEPKKS